MCRTLAKLACQVTIVMQHCKMTHSVPMEFKILFRAPWVTTALLVLAMVRSTHAPQGHSTMPQEPRMRAQAVWHVWEVITVRHQDCHGLQGSVMLVTSVCRDPIRPCR